MRYNSTTQEVITTNEVVVEDFNQQIGGLALGRRVRRHRELENGVPARVERRVTNFRLGHSFALVLHDTVGVGATAQDT